MSKLCFQFSLKIFPKLIVPKATYDFIMKNEKLAMEIPFGQKFIQTQRYLILHALKGFKNLF